MAETQSSTRPRSRSASRPHQGRRQLNGTDPCGDHPRRGHRGDI